MIIVIKDISEIEDAARKFLQLTAGMASVIAFYGCMGAGKTTFVKAICKELGVEDSVNSPTFTILNEYKDKNSNPVYHFDFYRIDKIEEVFDIGFEEFVDSGYLSLIEWPEKIEELLPLNCLKVYLSVGDDGSRVMEWSEN